MKNCLNLNQIESYRNRSLPPDELITICEHLAACEDCRLNLKAALPIADAAAAVSRELQTIFTEEPHLNYEEIAAFVNGTASSEMRDSMEEHFQSCPMCKEEMEDLRAFQSTLASYHHPAQGYQPAPRGRVWKTRSDELMPLLLRFVAQTTLAATAAGVLVFVLLKYVGSGQYASDHAELNNVKGKIVALEQHTTRLEQEKVDLTEAREQQKTDYARVLARTDNLEKLLLKSDQRNNRLVAEYNRLRLGRTSIPASGIEEKSTANFIAKAKNQEDKALFVSVLEHGKSPLTIAKIENLTTEKGITLSGDTNTKKTVNLERPRASFVQTPQPTFAWKPITGAVRYELRLLTVEQENIATVIIRKSGERWMVTTISPSLEVPTAQPTVWTYPSQLPALKSGTIYRWSVRAYGAIASSEPIAVSLTAKFQVQDEKTRQAVERVKGEYASSPLLLSILYASYGLLDDASELLQTYLQSHPHDTTAQALMLDIKTKQAPTTK